MKANLKGQGGIANILLMHGEKLGIVVVLIGAGYLVYSASGIDRLPETHQADRLVEKVRATQNRVANNTWATAVTEHPDMVKVAKPLIHNEAITVVPDAYAISGRGFNPAVITPSAPRTDPVLLAAEDVLARGGVGRMEFLDDAARERKEIIELREQAEREAEQRREQERLERENAAGRGARQRGGGDDQRGRDGRGGGVARSVPRGRQSQGGDLIELARWAVVVAKVPVREQRSRYYDAFENARGGFDEQADAPNYLGFLVERAEIRRAGEEPDWQPLAVYDAKATPTRKKLGDGMSGDTLVALDVAMQEWVTSSVTEVVDTRHLDPNGVLTYPLPPLIGREWGADATHPDIPLVGDAGADAYEIESPEEEVLPVTRPDAGDPFGFGAGNQLYGRGTGRSPGREFRGGRSEGRRGSFDSRESGRGRGDGRTGVATLARGVNHWLLRFYDFTVEPGKKYKYRVRLALEDPNLHVAPKDLDPTVQARIKELRKGPDGRPTTIYRFAPWSDPSPTVGIPESGGVRLAESAKASSGNLLGDDPKITLLVESFAKHGQADDWIQAAKEKEFSRGGVANFVDDAEAVVNGEFEKIRSFKFFSDMTVLDVRGGQQVGRNLSTPSRVLLMDPTGQLSIRNELDDALDVELHRQAIAEPDDARGR